jgi:hypothetical protein
VNGDGGSLGCILAALVRSPFELQIENSRQSGRIRDGLTKLPREEIAKLMDAFVAVSLLSLQLHETRLLSSLVIRSGGFA